MIVPIAMAAIGEIAPKGREGTMLGSFNVALFLGFGTGPLLGGIVMDILSIEAVFFFMGGLSALALILIILLLPVKKEMKKSGSGTLSTFRILWKANEFKGLLVFRFSNAIVRGSMVAFLPVFASRVSATPAQIGTLVSLNILLTAGLQHGFGRLADRLNRRGLIIAGNLLSGFPLLLTPFASEIVHLVVLSVIMGVGSGLAFPAALAVATDVGRNHGMGNVMGYFNTAMSLGMISGPIVSGLIMDLFGLSVVFIWGGLLGVLGSMVCVYLFFIKKGVIGYADV
jgi:MFS family permease